MEKVQHFFSSGYPEQSSIMAQQFVPADEWVVEIMSQGLSSYLVLFVMGLLCSIVSLPLLYTLFRSPRLRADSKLITCLAVGDMINCLALCVMGYARYELYTQGMKTGMVPLETSQTCAGKPYMWLRLIGNVWPPTVQLVMGIERTLACWTPVFFVNHIRKRSLHACILSVLIVLLFCLIGVVVAFTSKEDDYVKFDCGRKATFSYAYGQVLYCFEIAGYVIGLVLNAIAYFRCRLILCNDAAQEQLKRIRYYLAIATISTVLVALPNAKQLLLDHLKTAGLDEWLSQSFNWLSLIASSLNIFVYLILNREFRSEFCNVFSTRRITKVSIIPVQFNSGGAQPSPLKEIKTVFIITSQY
ncbi:hypothetical protein Y032_0021g443 [Ancylostoma ceylanicum]|nr:hypothetical protein Y032_0021g443 [Ancylostoma ceylanicum]